MRLTFSIWPTQRRLHPYASSSVSDKLDASSEKGTSGAWTSDIYSSEIPPWCAPLGELSVVYNAQTVMVRTMIKLGCADVHEPLLDDP